MLACICGRFRAELAPRMGGEAGVLKAQMSSFTLTVDGGLHMHFHDRSQVALGTHASPCRAPPMACSCSRSLHVHPFQWAQVQRYQRWSETPFLHGGGRDHEHMCHGRINLRAHSRAVTGSSWWCREEKAQLPGAHQTSSRSGAGAQGLSTT